MTDSDPGTGSGIGPGGLDGAGGAEGAYSGPGQGHPSTGHVVPITDRGLTEAGDVGHRDYALGKAAEGLAELMSARAPLQWQSEVERWGDVKTRHDMVMYGYQIMTGRTPDKGWKYEVVQRTPNGTFRRHDLAEVPPNAPYVGDTVEIKAGNVKRDDGLTQLRKEEFLLLTRQIRGVSEYVYRGAEPPHPDILAEARRLEQKFPGRFKLVALSEREFEKAIEIGRPIARAKAVEKLDKAIEQVRDTPELTTAFPALHGFVLAIERAEERGKPIALEVLVGARNDLADLIEVDREGTQRIDRMAREAAQLRLKDALVVEHVQAQRRDERYQKMQQILSRVDTAIVAAAARTVEARVVARDLEKIRAQVKTIPTPTVEKGNAMSRLLQQQSAITARMAQQAQVIREIEIHDVQQRALEREALDQLGLHPYYRDNAARVLEVRRQDATRTFLQEAWTASGPASAGQSEQDLEKERAAAKEREELARAREQEKREALERIVEAHNARLTEVAREQVAELSREDPQKPAKSAIEIKNMTAQIERAQETLRLDKEVMAQQTDPRALEGWLRGDAVWDQGLGAYTVEVGGETLAFAKSSYEYHYAEQIARVGRGQDLSFVHMQKLLKSRDLRSGGATSREIFEKERVPEIEKERALQREADYRTNARKRDQERERSRGRDRD